MQFSTLLLLALPALTVAIPAVASAANKPVLTATAKITVYSAFTCTSTTTPPPTTGSGPSTTVTLTEGQCSVIAIPVGSAITAALTVSPKVEATGCHVQIHTAGACVPAAAQAATDEIHGFPFDSTAVGGKVGCVSPPLKAYAALEIVCG